MLKKTKKGFYVLEEWVAKKDFTHAFSTRKFGNLREENKKINDFLVAVGLKKAQLVLMEQVHDNKIKTVTKKDKGRVLPGIDGIVCRQKGVVFGVKTADCLPVLLVDPQKKIAGAVHAGWKGILNKIVPKTVKKMVSLGAKKENILAGIGPHVGPCCYSVSRRRANQFEKEFGNLVGMICEEKEGPTLDLAIPTIVQLIKAGIERRNISFGDECTACNEKDFFSFRREGKNGGSLLSIIVL